MLVSGIAASGDWERQSAEHRINPLPGETAQAAKVARDGLCPSWPGATLRAASHVTPRLSVSGWRSSKNSENAGAESSLEIPLEMGQTHVHVSQSHVCWQRSGAFWVSSPYDQSIWFPELVPDVKAEKVKWLEPQTWP